MPLLVALGLLPPLLMHSQKNEAWSTLAVIVATSPDPKTSLKSMWSLAVNVIPLVVAVAASVLAPLPLAEMLVDVVALVNPPPPPAQTPAASASATSTSVAIVNRRFRRARPRRRWRIISCAPLNDGKEPPTLGRSDNPVKVRRKSSTALPSRLHEVQNGLIQVSTQKTGVDLTPYVPRLVLEWVRDQPEARWQRVDGTMAFIDISGFTRMSELLAAKGRAGAEEVTEIINATFARLLDVAYADGGGLLKFGGDALLLFFSGPQHEARAARAAFAMRRTLRTLGRPRTSAGAVTLKMHAGLHCGTFDFFLVGDAHRELIVTGPTATGTVEMESISRAGEIIVSAKVAERLDPGVLGEPRNGGRLLRGEAAAKGRFEPVPDVSELDLEALVPAAIRATLVEEATEGEHRQATVAFLAFSGTDRLLADLGPEEVAAALDRLVVSIQTAADAHRICFLESDVDKDGGRIILVAGVPETAGDDEERMLRALRAIVESPPGVSLRIGVNRGRVFAGEIGAPFRRTYTILGDTAALAARLMARADSGQILAAADVVERAATRFESAKLEPFRVKGKAEPVSAYEVGAIAADAGPVTIREQKLPLLGREREMTVLTASLTPARAGLGTLVELIGEPGIGKTRIIDELKLQASDMVIETAHCSEYESSTAYFPFRDLLRGLLDLPLNGGPEHNSALLAGRLQELDLKLAAWIPLLAMPLDVAALPTKEAHELQPAFRRARLHGVIELLLRAMLPDPSLLVFEDVHWMDEASTDLLRHLGSRVAQSPWVLCTTRQPSDGGFLAAQGVPVPALTLRLEPLSGAAAADLIAAAADGGIPKEEVDVITERAGGNPLFLQELIAAAIRSEEMEELPENVEAVVTTRIDELAPRDKLLLRWALVLGVSFDSRVITEVLAGHPSAAPNSESWDRLAEFVERDPYVPEGFRFRHALFRDAAYHGLSFNRRRELHARVAESLEHLYAERLDDVVELLSLHCHAAHRFDAAWRYAIAAGRRAQDKFANVEAAESPACALGRAPPARLSPESISEVWEALGDVSRLAGNYEGAAEAFRRARRSSAKDSARQPRLFLKEGRLREEMGETARAQVVHQGVPGRRTSARAGSGPIWSGSHSLKERRASGRAGSGSVSNGARRASTSPSPRKTCAAWHTVLPAPPCLHRPGQSRANRVPRACLPITRSSTTCWDSRTCSTTWGSTRTTKAVGIRRSTSMGGPRSCASESAMSWGSPRSRTTLASCSPTRAISTRPSPCSQRPSTRLASPGRVTS